MGKSKKGQSSRLSQSHPLAKRKTVSTIENQKGEVIKIDETNFGIRQAEGDAVLLPVNLPGEFRKSGTRIKFSGQLKETSLTELWAGQPILLNQIEEI